MRERTKSLSEQLKEIVASNSEVVVNQRKDVIDSETCSNIASFLFKEQILPADFLKSFEEFLKNKFAELNCVVCYAHSSSFREFMSKFPDLDYGSREVTVLENGKLFFQNNFRIARDGANTMNIRTDKF